MTGAAVDATKQTSGPRLTKSSANIRSSSGEGEELGWHWMPPRVGDGTGNSLSA